MAFMFIKKRFMSMFYKFAIRDKILYLFRCTSQPKLLKMLTKVTYYLFSFMRNKSKLK